jgi:hypothetical protein
VKTRKTGEAGSIAWVGEEGEGRTAVGKAAGAAVGSNTAEEQAAAATRCIGVGTAEKGQTDRIAAAAAARSIGVGRAEEGQTDRIAAAAKSTAPGVGADTAGEGIETPSIAIAEAAPASLPSSFRRNQTPDQTAEAWRREAEDPTAGTASRSQAWRRDALARQFYQPRMP